MKHFIANKNSFGFEIYIEISQLLNNGSRGSCKGDTGKRQGILKHNRG